MRGYILKIIDPCITSPGDKVIFAYPTNGWSNDQNRAFEHLVVGKEYTIKDVVVGDWSSLVVLKEVPGVRFNSVHFAAPGEEVEETDEVEYTISDGEGGTVDLGDASPDQMRNEIKRLIELIESIDAHNGSISAEINTWRNLK